jgi:hypothetical protein
VVWSVPAGYIIWSVSTIYSISQLIQLITINNLKTFTMHRVDIFSFLASDAGELTKMQTRLNQWMTAKSLVKYEIHTAGEYIIFNVCRKKEDGA